MKIKLMTRLTNIVKKYIGTKNFKIYRLSVIDYLFQ